MAKRKRQKYTREFKEEAVKLVTEQDYQVAEAARNLGIHPNMLSRWKSEITGSDESPGEGSNLKDVHAELRRLRKENKRLKMECGEGIFRDNTLQSYACFSLWLLSLA